ncbi:hypothetical protein T484DRAFT_1915278 [Baffinella frigidus]|nr:hypothetical protein T484DRAFT_1915278 [Cryptophyta sp. CCMP2293]
MQNAVSKGRLVSSTSMQCVTGAVSIVGPSTVDVSFNGVDYTESGALYRYTPEPEVSKLVPSRGVEQGGTRVTVVGSGFDESDDLLCFFGRGSSGVPAEWLRSDRLVCVTPEAPAGNVTFSLSLAGHMLHGTHRRFIFVGAPSIHSVLPSTILTQGGSSVSILGANLPMHTPLLCRFSGESEMRNVGDVTDSTAISSTLAVCSTPPLPVGSVTLHIGAANDNLDETGVLLSVVPAPVIHRVTLPPGAGILFLEAEHITVGSAAFWCCFNGVAHARADVVADGVAECPLPRDIPGGSLLVELSLTGGSGGGCINASAFLYTPLPTPAVRRVLPSAARETAVALVSVLGENFVAGEALMCAFGRVRSVRVVADFVSSSLVRCAVPREGFGNVSVHVSNDGVDLGESSGSFLFSDGAMVSSIYPSRIPRQGGVVITLLGHGFVPPSFPISVEGARVECAVVNRSVATCVSPPMETGIAHVALPLGMDAVLPSRAALLYVESPVVKRVVPSAGWLRGQAVVSVFGRHFEAEGMACEFGGAESVPAVVVSSSSLRCMSPSFHEAQAVSLEVSVDGSLFRSSGVEFNFEAPPLLVGVSPVFVQAAGSETVTLRGEHFTSGSNLSVSFGHLQELGRDMKVVSSSVVTVVVPALAGLGNMSVEVTNNGVDFVPSGVTVTVMREVMLVSINPSRVSAAGGSTVIVTGSGMLGDSLPMMFGDREVICKVDSEEQAACRLTASDAGAVRVYAKGQHAATLEFVFDAVATIMAILPTTGPVSGGTLVTIAGDSFTNSSGLACRIGDGRLEPARFVTSSLVLCYTPAGPPGAASLQVFVDASQASENSASFLYTHVPIVRRIRPSVGVELQATIITLIGERFSATSSAFATCDFGAARSVLALYVSDEEVTCLGSNLPPGNYSVRLVVETHRSDPVLFRVGPALTIHTVTPEVVSTGGGDTVTISGANFKTPDTVWCVFITWLGPVRSEASVVDAHSLTCAAPPHQTARVALGVHGEGLAAALPTLQITYAACSYYEVGPSSGPESGGTLVTLSGSFQKATRVLCRFGTSTPLLGTVESSFVAVCVAPPRPTTGAVTRVLSIAVEADGLACSAPRNADASLFRYDPEAVVLSVEPSAADTEGRVVTVRGENFAHGGNVRCMVGMQEGRNVAVESDTPVLLSSSFQE